MRLTPAAVQPDHSVGGGLNDAEEALLALHPSLTSPAGNGVPDLVRFQLQSFYGIGDPQGDSNGDGTSDAAKVVAGLNPLDPASHVGNDPNLDADGNGLPDAWEMKYFGHLGNDPLADPDGDKLTNLQEYLLHTDPTKKMTDGVHLDGQGDQDGDGVLDVWELEDGTDPFDANSYDLATNYVVLRGLVQHLDQWGPVSDQSQFDGTVLRATAIGFETAQQTQTTAYGIVNEVSGFAPSGNDYVAQRYVRFRKGVQYQVELTTTSNNLPFVSGRYFWTGVGNSDEPDNKFFTFTVDGRQTYVADGSGQPVPATAISPDPDVNRTYFTLATGSGAATATRGTPSSNAARPVVTSAAPDPVSHPTGKAALPPAAVLDLKNVSDTTDDVTVNTFNLKTPTLSKKADVIRAKNKYWQGIGDVYARIVPHRNDGIGNPDDPRMPQLQFSVPMLGPTYQVKWKFQCAYTRGNGFRVTQKPPTGTPPDSFTIPTDGSFTTLAGDAPWKVYNDPAWKSDFFGGDCAVIYQVMDASGAAITGQLTRNFVIGGLSPQNDKAKSFVNAYVATASPTLYFAYAIAKEESGPYSLGALQYNQFFTIGLINPKAQSGSDWRAWRPLFPSFNDDPSGPGGYGMFQNTRFNPNIGRKEIWNWQDNSRAGVDEIKGKITMITTPLLATFKRTYPNAPALPGVSYTYPVPKSSPPQTVTRSVSGADAITITAYNGFGKLPKRNLILADGKPHRRVTPWTYEGGKWTFHPNQNDYARRVLSQFE